ncbi:MAG: HAD-IA family hydrolase [Planctomycetota bacterium]|nr:HAD-IA family hydrolase [Planctomycetota bacterium]
MTLANMSGLFIFDLDGTLVDSTADLAASINAMRARFGLVPLPVPHVAGCVGEGVRLLVERCLADAQGVSVEEAVRLFSAHYADHCLDTTCLLPGVAATTEKLAARAMLAVVSNKPEVMTRKILDALGLMPLMSAVIGGDSTAGRKPDAAPVLEALRRTGARPEDALMVGDGWTDIAAGKAAGVKPCYVPGIGARAKAEAAGPDFTVERFEELAERF